MSSPSAAIPPRKLADRLQALAEHAAHRSLIVEADALRACGTPVALIEPGLEDLAAMGLNLMNPKRGQVVLDTAVRTVARQLRSMPIPSHLGPNSHWS